MPLYEVISPNLTSRWAVDSGVATILYIGEGQTGISDAASAWRICKIDSGGGSVMFAGNGEFDQVWEDREGLNYA